MGTRAGWSLRRKIWRTVSRELWPGLAQLELREGANVLESTQKRLLWSVKPGYKCLEQAGRQVYMYDTWE